MVVVLAKVVLAKRNNKHFVILTEIGGDTSVFKTRMNKPKDKEKQ